MVRIAKNKKKSLRKRDVEKLENTSVATAGMIGLDECAGSCTAASCVASQCIDTSTCQAGSGCQATNAV